jgi:hypothetical protein
LPRGCHDDPRPAVGTSRHRAGHGLHARITNIRPCTPPADSECTHAPWRFGVRRAPPAMPANSASGRHPAFFGTDPWSAAQGLTPSTREGSATRACGLSGFASAVFAGLRLSAGQLSAVPGDAVLPGQPLDVVTNKSPGVVPVLGSPRRLLPSFYPGSIDRKNPPQPVEPKTLYSIPELRKRARNPITPLMDRVRLDSTVKSAAKGCAAEFSNELGKRTIAGQYTRSVCRDSRSCVP